MTDPYHEVPYPGLAFPQTHPDRLATLAALFGLDAPPAGRCRVLEIGCGDGGNLIPMAFGLPESEFLGIDLAEEAIASGRELIATLGLSNISLRAQDILEIAPDIGQLDYIVCHGVYSWVPEAVREKILQICASNLAPKGVAFVSYNTYPGGHLRNMLREMMLYRAEGILEPERKIQESRSLVRFLAETASASDAYGLFLREELQQGLERNDALLYHDDLAPVNSRVYFHQFNTLAARHGLDYLVDAELNDHRFRPQLAECLRPLAENDLIKREQYFDFLSCRTFRQTLLCHLETAPERSLRPERLTAFRFASPVESTPANPDVNSPAVVKFQGRRKASLSTGHPLAKAALVELGRQWPCSLSFNELLARVRLRLGRSAAGANPDGLVYDSRELAEILLLACGANLAEPHLALERFTTEPGPRPEASALARAQLRLGRTLTNLRHEPVEPQDLLSRRLLALLDGTRDREELGRELADLVKSGAVVLEENGRPLEGDARIAAFIASGLEVSLHQLARMALLVS